MTSRATAIMVAVAVVAGAAVAGVGLATRGSGNPARVLQIDEQKGSVGNIVLGETTGNVIGVLGKPTFANGRFMRYPHVVLELSAGRVTSIATNDSAARTDKVVRIGDPLSAARASYRKEAKCDPSSPDETTAHPRCLITFPSRRLWIYGDPIGEIRLVRTG